jgi:hypothetical protein
MPMTIPHINVRYRRTSSRAGRCMARLVMTDAVENVVVHRFKILLGH